MKRSLKILIATLALAVVSTVSTVGIIFFAKKPAAETPIVHTISYEVNDGSYIPSQQITDGERLTPIAVSKSGYRFGGWYLDQAYTQTFDFNTAIEDSLTLHAKWIKVYTVNFVTGEGSAIEEQTIDDGSLASEPVENPIRDGYVFDGWYKDENYVEAFDFATSIEGDTTLYALWTKLWTVHFETNGGTVVADQSIKNGMTIVVPTTPTRTGYEWAGWYNTDGSMFTYDTLIQSNRTIVGKWYLNVQYVTREPGTNDIIIVHKTEQLMTGQTPDEAYEPARTGYTLRNWLNLDYSPYDFYKPLNEHAIIYADWNINSYWVSWNPNNGLPTNGKYVTYNSVLERELPIYTKEGCEFLGWYDEDNQLFDHLHTPVSGALNLHAEWKELFNYAAIDGNNYEITGYNGTDTTVVLPKMHNNQRVVKIGQNAFRDNTTITSVMLPVDGWYDTIGVYAFYGCNKIVSVTLPDSVRTIAEYAFQKCSKMETLTISNGLRTIGISAFEDCSKLPSFEFPNGVTEIGKRAFASCLFTAIHLPASVTNLDGEAFDLCSKLETITVDVNNTKYTSQDNGTEVNAIIDVDSATLLRGCKNTVIPESVTKLGSGAFYGCSGLTAVYIHSGITTIGTTAFYRCYDLAAMTVDPNNTVYKSRDNSGNEINGIIKGTVLVNGCKNTVIPNGITKIGENAFGGHNGLTSLIIPEGVQYINNYAFQRCTKLTSVSLPSSLISIGLGAFYLCNNIKVFALPSSVTTLGKNVFQDWNNTQTIYLERTAVPSSGWNSQWNNSCSANIVWNADITSDCTFTLNSAGTGYTLTGYTGSRTGLFLPTEYNGLPVTAIGAEAFKNKTALKYVKIPEGVTKIGTDAFRYSGLVQIDLPDSLLTIGSSSLSSCKLINLVIPRGVILIEAYALCWYSTICSMRVDPNNTVYTSCDSQGKELNAILTKADHTFVSGCINTVEIPNGIQTLDVGAFAGRTITTIEIPNTVTQFKNEVFSNCTSLTSLVIPSSVTTIKGHCFNNTPKLKTIVIPASVTTTGANIFNGWNNTQTVYIEATEIPSGWNENWNVNCNAQILMGNEWHYENGVPVANS